MVDVEASPTAEELRNAFAESYNGGTPAEAGVDPREEVEGDVSTAPCLQIRVSAKNKTLMDNQHRSTTISLRERVGAGGSAGGGVDMVISHPL